MLAEERLDRRTAPGHERWHTLARMVLLILVSCTALAVLVACASPLGERASTQPTEKGATMSIQVTSSAFREGETIPTKYTCDGEDVSPPLRWSGLPSNTKSVAIVMEDPDAPSGTFTHWVIYDIPGNVSELPEGVPARDTVLGAAKQGINSFNRLGYRGPCPPRGSTHRYFFHVYALDAELGLGPGVAKSQVMSSLQGHILAEGQLMGRYGRR